MRDFARLKARDLEKEIKRQNYNKRKKRLNINTNTKADFKSDYIPKSPENIPSVKYFVSKQKTKHIFVAISFSSQYPTFFEAISKI